MSDILVSLKALQLAAIDARALAQQALESCDEVLGGLDDLIRAVTPTPAPTPAPEVVLVTESYWQIGFNDGRALREPSPPGRPYDDGYFNGYRAGKAKTTNEALS